MRRILRTTAQTLLGLTLAALSAQAGPIDIGSRLELFVEDYLIVNRDYLFRVPPGSAEGHTAISSEFTQYFVSIYASTPVPPSGI